MAQIIKNDRLGRVIRKTPVRKISRQVLAVGVSDPNLYGEGLIHSNNYNPIWLRAQIRIKFNSGFHDFNDQLWPALRHFRALRKTDRRGRRTHGVGPPALSSG